jgi:hypothetical protein
LENRSTSFEGCSWKGPFKLGDSELLRRGDWRLSSARFWSRSTFREDSGVIALFRIVPKSHSTFNASFLCHFGHRQKLTKERRKMEKGESSYSFMRRFLLALFIICGYFLANTPTRAGALGWDCLNFACLLGEGRGVSSQPVPDQAKKKKKSSTSR